MADAVDRLEMPIPPTLMTATTATSARRLASHANTREASQSAYRLSRSQAAPPTADAEGAPPASGTDAHEEWLRRR